MPTIYDNKNTHLFSGLKDALKRSSKSDICTAYFNLRGWKKIASLIEAYQPENGGQCRLLLGMYGQGDHFRKEIAEEEEETRKVDGDKARKLKSEALQNLRKQLMKGIPTNEDEAGLKKLAQQLRDKKVIIKCFTRHPLHAKLYLTFNEVDFAKKIGFLGSSNFTLAGLEKNGELNIDILDQQNCEMLCNWFEEKWEDTFSLDISQKVIDIIEASWAGDMPYLPYHIYIKMAYHLSEDARKGLSDFFIPKELKDILFDFQAKAVRIATHYVCKKGGVLIGDVVGLGKTYIAIAVAKILEEEYGHQTLVLCPKNLEKMWNEFIQHPDWGLRGRVVPTSVVHRELPNLKRHHVIILDESHNLRNPQTKTYKIIQDYISQNESKCILLSATPYNKTYIDLSSQLGLFIDRDADLGIRPTKFLSEEGCNFFGSDSTLKAFENSTHPEDWQQLMAQFLVRRTRSFIKENYGYLDKSGRCYMKAHKGEKKFFPERIAKTVKYKIDGQYRKLFSEEVVNMINELKLARYDLNSYKKKNLEGLSKEEKDIFKDLERSRAHPKGFCRIGFFKRLESSGFAFLKSVQKHILRNCVFIYAIENNEKLFVKAGNSDIIIDAFDDTEGGITGFLEDSNDEDVYCFMEFDSYYQKAEKAYKKYKTKRKIHWISSSYFNENLLSDLRSDTENLISVLKGSKEWSPKKDLKIKKLEELLNKNYIKKAIVFSQSKETAEYLKEELSKRKMNKIALATGGMSDIQQTIKCFSPISNNENISSSDEIDILIATDVLSEGQNLQDCNTVINYDLPWAIIKLVQRVGRVDRIGQKEDKIYCHSFLPDDGLESLIQLKSRIQKRLRENAEVIGTDEQFFQDEKQLLTDLYSEKSSVLEKEMEEIDLPSYALEIWNKAIKKDPSLEGKIKEMPDSIHSSMEFDEKSNKVLLFAKSHISNDLLELDEKGNIITENQKEVLDKSMCTLDTPPKKRERSHYEVVKLGLESIKTKFQSVNHAGRLGTTRNPRKKIYDLFEKMSDKNDEDKSILDEIYMYPLLSDAESVLARMFRRKKSANEIREYIREKSRGEILVNKKESKRMSEKPRIICSMGLIKKEK